LGVTLPPPQKKKGKEKYHAVSIKIQEKNGASYIYFCKTLKRKKLLFACRGITPGGCVLHPLNVVILQGCQTILTTRLSGKMYVIQQQNH
jgi:hypothetical protein